RQPDAASAAHRDLSLVLEIQVAALVVKQLRREPVDASREVHAPAERRVALVGALVATQVDRIETAAQRQLRPVGGQQLHAEPAADRAAQIDVAEPVLLERTAQIPETGASGEEAVV